MAPKAKRTTKTSAAARRAVRPAPVARRQETGSGKPVVRVGTLAAIVIFAAIILFALILNRQKQATEASATPTPGTSYVFDQTEGNPSSIEVKPTGEDAESVKVARDEKNAWTVELPIKLEADQGLSESAASQLKALIVISEVEGDPSIFGLDKPAYVITVEFDGGKKHTLEVGDATPTNSGYYVRLDNKKMMVASLSGINSLTNLITFPPYLNTPTPTPLPETATPVPPTETPTQIGTESSVTPTP